MLRMLCVAAMLLIAGSLAEGAAADDRQTCRIPDDGGVAACTRIIEGGSWSRRDRVDAFINRGQTHYERNELERAIRDFDGAINLEARFAMPYVNRGNSWFRKKDYDFAIADYTEAIGLDRTFTAAYTGRGLAHQAKGDTARAIADYKAALAAPQKYDDGQWAHDTARAQLRALGAN